MWLEKSLGRETSAPARKVRTRATVKAQRMRRSFMDISGGYLYNSASIRRAWIGWRMQRKSPDRVRAFCFAVKWGLFGPAFEDEGAVGAAEAEGVRERVVDLYRLGFVGDVVEAALWV